MPFIRSGGLSATLLFLGMGVGSAAELDTCLNQLMQDVQNAVVAVEAFRPEVLTTRSGQDAAAEAPCAAYRLMISSGVLLDEGRHVVTIASGVDGCDSVLIRLQSGKRVPAKLHAKDPDLNVALLQVLGAVEPPATLPTGPVMEDLLDRKGWVAVLGYSSGMNEPLFTIGRLCGLSYTRMGQRTMGMLRTTAPIFAGCSGGALVDLEGRWLGLLSGSCVLESEAGSAAEGLFLSTRPYAALALPVHDVLATVERLRNQVRTDVGFLGVRIPQGEEEGVEESEGIEVLEVIEQCPAHQAGLVEGDVIVRIDGSSVTGSRSLSELMAQKKPGETAVLEVLRNREPLVIEIRLGSRVRFEQQTLAMERERIQEKQIREQIRRLQEMLTYMGQGVVPRLGPADTSPPVERSNSSAP